MKLDFLWTKFSFQKLEDLDCGSVFICPSLTGIYMKTILHNDVKKIYCVCIVNGDMHEVDPDEPVYELDDLVITRKE